MTTLKEMIEKQEAEQLQAAIDWAGGQTVLAQFLGTSPQTVSNWVARGRISASAAADLEKKTSGKFKKSEMRPDVKDWYL